MMIIYQNEKYNFWSISSKEFVLTARWDKANHPIIKGTLDEIERYAEQHPYRITRKELGEIGGNDSEKQNND